MKVIAIEPFDGNQPGAEVEVTERQAQQLVEKRLAKMRKPVSNKMRAEPENKANPSPAVGKGRRSSASPAARVSRRTTAKKSGRGATGAKTDE